ncbi:MAG TPA: YheC/YheD family protein [Bacilli bacterium]|nr:YheC/YheD family protein [Bacilli bacterium]
MKPRKSPNERKTRRGTRPSLYGGTRRGARVFSQEDDNKSESKGEALRELPPVRTPRTHAGSERPVIGILTLGVRDDRKRPIGGRTGLLGDFVRAALEQNVTCYVFNAGAVDWIGGTVRGVTMESPDGKGSSAQWKRGRFPLPDIVYNRVPHRKGERSEAVLRCKRRFEELGIPLFNERFLNKREMYRFLLNDPRSRDLIPETEPLRKFAPFEAFLQRHELVYLKPTGGSLGSGILRVRRSSQGGYHVRLRSGKRHVSRTFVKVSELYDFVRQTGTGRVYLMQQGVDLKRHEGNRTDFRVHLHKNGAGEWEAAGIGAKVAGSGAVTTHVHNGGHVLNGDEVLETWYGPDADEMRDKLIAASVQVAVVLQGLLHGPVGEFGLDVAIDEADRIFVFESNAKPGRAIFKHPDLRAAGRRSAQMVIEYAGYLAQQRVTEGGIGG